MLLIGAVDVRSGEFKAFNSRRDRISAEMILASAAIPNLFRSVQIDGASYWDGLFSQNPPVRELVDLDRTALGDPDQPQALGRGRGRWSRSPTGATNSPATSRCTKLGFIEKIDQLLEEGRLAADGKYKQIMVRLIELSRPRRHGRSAPPQTQPRSGFLRELIAPR